MQKLITRTQLGYFATVDRYFRSTPMQEFLFWYANQPRSIYHYFTDFQSAHARRYNELCYAISTHNLLTIKTFNYSAPKIKFDYLNK